MKHWIIYFLCILSLMYLTLLYNSPGGIFLIEVMLFFVFFLIFLLVLQRRKIKVTIEIKDQWMEQGSAAIPVKISNQSRIPLSKSNITFMLENRWSKEIKKYSFLNRVGEKGEQYDEIDISEVTSGVWSVTVSNIRIYDLTGCFCIRKKDRQQKKIIVMPPLYEANIKSTQGEIDYSYIEDVREFQPEDSIRNIHWKLSMKKEKYLVKVFGKEEKAPIDFYIASQINTEKLLVIVYAIAYGLWSNGIPFYFYWNSNENQLCMEEVLVEEDVYGAMETFMEQGITQEIEEEIEYVLYLNSNLQLFYEKILVANLAEGNLQEKLLEMELFI